MHSSTQTLIKSLKILANDIESEDGVANAAIHEAAGRLEEVNNVLKEARSMIDYLATCTIAGKWPSEAIKELYKKLNKLDNYGIHTDQ